MAEIKKYLDLQVGLPQLVTEIKAADEAVLAAAKKHAEDLGANYDVAGAAATAEANAKAHAETKVNELANGQVKLNKEAIEKLNGNDTTEGSVAKAVKDAKDALQANIDKVDEKAGKNAEDIAAINNADTGILKQAKDYTDTEVAKVQGEVDALETLVGTLPEDTTAATVVEYVNVKIADIATDAALEELQGQLNGVQGEVATIKGDYLKAADKTELEGKITAAQNAADKAQGEVDELETVVANNKTAIEGTVADLEAKVDENESDIEGKMTALTERVVANETAVGTTLPNAINAEKERAVAKEDELAGAIAAIKEDVDAFFADADMTESAKDTLKELQEYIASDESGASAMAASIKQNADDIDALEGRMETAETALGTVDSRIATAVENAITGANLDQYATDTELNAAVERIGALETADATQDGLLAGLRTDVDLKATKAELEEAIEALEGIDTEQAEKIAALEAKFGEGEGNVADMIADAVADGVADAVAQAEAKDAQVLVDAKAYTDQEVGKDRERLDALEAIDHDHANKAELDKFVDGDKAKLDEAYAKLHEHANKSVLDGITSDKVTAWDNAEQNAKTYADGLNTAMTTKVDGVDNRVKALEEDIVDKAETSTVTALAERVTANEGNIAANTAKLNSFVAISAEEVTALFQ